MSRAHRDDTWVWLLRVSDALPLGIISALLSPFEIAIDAPAPTTDVLPLEFSFCVRPPGRIMLLGQVPCLSRFRTLSPDTRLWMRWFEPDRDDAQIVIAATDADADDERALTARVLARGCVRDRMGAWDLYRVAQAQGVVDLLLAGPTAPDGSLSEVLHLLVCADLSQRAEDFGLSVDPFPGRYQ